MKFLTTKQIAIPLLFILSASSVYAADSYRVNVSQSVDIDEYAVCKKVTNNCSDDIFVPTKTSPEWEAFRNNKPACVTLAECFVCGTDTVDDADGNTYNTVLIGGQCWMAENLDYDGSPSDNGCKLVTWVNDSDEGWCDYYDPDCLPSGCSNEGLLYQWSVTQQAGLCPSGWHVPSDVEYQTLEIFLGMCPTGAGCADDTLWRGTTEGDEMKKAGLCEGRNPCGTSGFAGLLAGYRGTNGSFSLRGAYAYLWSSTPSGGDAWFRYLGVSSAGVYRSTSNKAGGFSVRCLRD